MSERDRVIQMPPPPAVRHRVDEIRRLEPPAGLLEEVMRAVDETSQQRPGHSLLRTAGWAAAIAAAAVVAGVLLSGRGNIGDRASPTPLPSTSDSAAGTPLPLDQLPVAGSLQATIPIGSTDILTLGAFGSVWLADQEAGVVKRVDPAAREVVATHEVRPAGQGGRLWLAATEQLLWAGVGGTPALVGLDPDTGDVVHSVALDVDPFTLAAGFDQVWLTDPGRGVVVGIDASTGAEIHRVAVAGATGVTVGGQSVWVASTQDNAVVEIDRSSGQVLRSIATGPTPMQVFVDDAASTVYVIGRDGMAISAVDTASGVLRRGSKEITAFTFVDGEPWGLIPGGLLIGRLDPQTLEFVSVVELPTGNGEGLVYEGGLVWAIDAENLFGVRPQS